MTSWRTDLSPDMERDDDERGADPLEVAQLRAENVALKARAEAAEAMVAALRSVGERFFDFIAGLEAFEHGNGDGDRLAGDLEEVLADTSKAAEAHDAAVRKAALEYGLEWVKNHTKLSMEDKRSVERALADSLAVQRLEPES